MRAHLPAPLIGLKHDVFLQPVIDCEDDQAGHGADDRDYQDLAGQAG